MTNEYPIILFSIVFGSLIYFFFTKKNLKEGFWMTPSKQVKVESVIKDRKTNNVFQVPNFQSSLSPRISPNVDYGAYLRNNFPDEKMMATTQSPLEQYDSDIPIVYDRYIYANRNSRLRSQGDPIRGDLPITPLNGTWFVPNAAAGNNINQTLQQGAMNVMGGLANETNRNLAKLMNKSSDFTTTTFGGINLSHQTFPKQKFNTDVEFTSFP